MADYEEIRYEVDDPVATITLDRPQVLNAWTDRMGAEVRNAVAAAEHDPRVVGIVITGAGRGFCAGADMNTLTAISDGERSATEILAELRVRSRRPAAGDDLRGGEYTYLLSVPKPVVAAVNGAGGGHGRPSCWPATCGSWPRMRCSRPPSPSAASSPSGA